MKTYRINGSVVGGKYLGEVEAESAEEAIKKAYDELDISVSLCHFCSDECENADVESISAYSDDGESATDADDLRARVAELEDALLEIDKWQTGENNIEDDEDWEADDVLRRRVRAIVKQALAGRKEG